MPSRSRRTGLLSVTSMTSEACSRRTLTTNWKRLGLAPRWFARRGNQNKHRKETDTMSIEETTKYYNVFHRTWWKHNPDWPQGREPGAGRKTYLARHVTWADARAICERYNSTHTPGPLSRKAEFEEA